MKILICLGTRPEWLKIKPITKVLEKNNYDLFFTGQHEDLLKDINFDYNVEIIKNNNRLDDIISSCMVNFPSEKYDYVLVQGDTGSALGCALAAYNRKIKVIHLEAGLRTYDLENPYPEESYRQIISRISSINLCPTELSKQNLVNEKVSGQIYVVGNTVLDNLITLKEKTSYGNDVLVTLHRRENHDIMDKWFIELNLLCEKYPKLNFILPIHPNPNVQKHRHILNKKIKVVDPLIHNDLIKTLLNCRFVITDSGGIQEEATFFNKKSIVCRKTTERPEGINTGHLILCNETKDLEDLVYIINNDYYINNECPYGDGHSSKKIIKILKNDYSNT
jgi:UDP-N-acetylglucosamine 2-epimerase (non-hydrolysing)